MLEWLPILLCWYLSLGLDTMHKKTKGNIGETAAALFLMKRGYEVFTELGDSSKIDLIVPYNGRCITIQVKAVVSSDGVRFKSKLRSSGPGYSYTYTSDDVDILCVYELTSETITWIAVTELETISRLSVTYVFEEQTHRGGPAQNLAADFLSFERAANLVGV